MHPFGSFLAGKEMMDTARPADDDWRALHRRPDAPPLPEPPVPMMSASFMSRVARAVRRAFARPAATKPVG